MEKFLSVMNRILAPIKREMRTMIVRGIVRIITEDSKIQVFQVESFQDDVRDDVEHFQTFGFKSHTPANSEVIMLNVGGSNEHSVVVATENREALSNLDPLEEGDSIIYNKGGASLLLKEKNIEASIDKIKIENDSNELIAVLIEWLDQAIVNRNITAIGPQPLFPADVVEMQKIKAKLETFKL